MFGLNAGGVGVTPTFSLNDSSIKNLEHVTLRAAHNDPAVMKIGERYPIVNATFAPIYNSAAISSVIGNQSYIAPIPSFNFEDLGLVLKVTPLIHSNEDVSMKLELQLRSLGTTNNNGIPIINNREYTGTITVKNGESSVVTGLIDMDDFARHQRISLPGNRSRPHLRRHRPQQERHRGRAAGRHHPTHPAPPRTNLVCGGIAT